MVSMDLVPWGVGAILGNGMQLKDKIMLHCFWEVKYQRGFTTEIQY